MQRFHPIRRKSNAAFGTAGILFGMALAVSTMLLTGPTHAQTSPTPGPTNPAPQPSNPLAKPGSDLVINPTAEECAKGWQPGLKWTRDQFDAFCKQIRTSK